MNLSLHSYLDMILNINDLLHYGLTKKGYKNNPTVQRFSVTPRFWS